MLDNQLQQIERHEEDKFRTIIEENVFLYRSNWYRETMLSAEEIPGNTCISPDNITTEHVSLPDEVIKNNYQTYLLSDMSNMIQSNMEEGNPFHNTFLLYSGEKYVDIQKEIFTGFVSKKLQKHAYLLVQAFIDYCSTLSGQDLQNAIGQFYKNFLASSDSIGDYLSDDKKFIILSQLLKTDELNFIKSRFLGDFHYHFVFASRYSLDLILDEIMKGTEENALNALNMMSLVISSYGGYDLENLGENVEYFCNRILQKYDNKFFSYKVQSILQGVDYIIMNDLPPPSIDYLQTISYVKFEGFTLGRSVRVSSDYVSLHSDSGYSKGMVNYSEKYDYANGIDRGELYSFVEHLKSLTLPKVDSANAFKIYICLDTLFFSILEKKQDVMKLMCEEALGEEDGKKLFHIFMNSIYLRDEKIDEFNYFVEPKIEQDPDFQFTHEFNQRYEELNNTINNYINEEVTPQITQLFQTATVISQEQTAIVLEGMKYDQVLESNSIDIYGLLKNKELSLFMQEMHHPEMMHMISNDLGVDIASLSLQNQVHLLRFLWQQNNQEYNKFKDALEHFTDINNKFAFLNTFLVCSEKIELGNKLIELAGFDESEKIFQAYSSLVQLQEQAYTDIDFGIFLRTILARGRGLLEDAYESVILGEDIFVDEKYEASLVKSGALVKALFEGNKTQKIMGMHEFNEKSPDFEVNIFSGGGIIESKETIDMMFEHNYIQPDKFNKFDYEMLVGNISQTYAGIDDELIKILYKDIPQDLSNEKVKFYMLREKGKQGKKGRLLALCKIAEKEDGSIYWGTHYVEPDYRGNFGIGSYIAKLAFQDYEKQDIHAIVAKNNPSLEAQINHSNFVGTQMITDIGHGMESNLMVGIRLFRNNVFQTKDASLLPDIKIKNQIGKHGNYECCVVDSRPGYDQEYISLLQNKFVEGYVLTRIFYDRIGKQSNLEKTYLVFEKISQDENNRKENN